MKCQRVSKNYKIWNIIISGHSENARKIKKKFSCLTDDSYTTEFRKAFSIHSPKVLNIMKCPQVKEDKELNGIWCKLIIQ